MELGEIFITRAVVDVISPQEIVTFLKRYENLDWGDICDEDKQTNEDALIFGDRILALYHTEKGIKFYIITESDRSITTILLADEYQPF